MNDLMFCAPWAGSWTPCTASSSADISNFMPPDIALLALICSSARITPLRVGMPLVASAPETGMSTPILTTLPAAEAGTAAPSVELTATLSATASAVANATGRLCDEIIDSLRTNAQHDTRRRKSPRPVTRIARSTPGAASSLWPRGYE